MVEVELTATYFDLSFSVDTVGMDHIIHVDTVEDVSEAPVLTLEKDG